MADKSHANYTSIDYLNDVRKGVHGMMDNRFAVSASVKAAHAHGVEYDLIKHAFYETSLACYLTKRGEKCDDVRARSLINDLHETKFDKVTKKQIFPPAKDGKGYRTPMQNDGYGSARVAWIEVATTAGIYVKKNVTRAPQTTDANIKSDAPVTLKSLVIEHANTLADVATQLMSVAAYARSIIDNAGTLVQGEVGTDLNDAVQDFMKFVSETYAKLVPEETPKA